MIRIDRNGVSVPIPPDVIEQAYAAQDAALKQGKTLDESAAASGTIIDAYVANLPTSWFPSVQPSLKAKDGKAYDAAIAKLDPRDVAAKQAHIDQDYAQKVVAYGGRVAAAAAEKGQTSPPNEPEPEPAAPTRGVKAPAADSEG